MEHDRHCGLNANIFYGNHRFAKQRRDPEWLAALCPIFGAGAHGQT